VNVGHHDVDDWKENYDLFIHELAHFHVQRNHHLFEGFWRAVSDIGAKLAQVALERPELFPKDFKTEDAMAANLQISGRCRRRWRERSGGGVQGCGRGRRARGDASRPDRRDRK
jgi:hypothetical protein